MKTPIELAEEYVLKVFGSDDTQQKYSETDCVNYCVNAYITGYEAAQPKWISVEKDAPYDGDYLCYLEQKQECGNVWYKQMVLQNTMNRFIIPSG